MFSNTLLLWFYGRKIYHMDIPSIVRGAVGAQIVVFRVYTRRNKIALNGQQFFPINIISK